MTTPPAARRQGVAALALGLLLLLAGGARAAPNILLVYVDDLGYGDLGSYGHPVLATPVIDRLAAEGVRFTQFYAPSALCSPSRAGLLTGRTPYRTGIRDWIPDGSPIALGASETTLADLAKAQGYRTAVIGKWHLNGGLGDVDAPQPRDFGFDHQFGLAAFVKNDAVDSQSEQPRRGHLYPDNFYRNNQPLGPTDRYSAELVSDEALRWLSTEDEAPFFLLLTYSEPHTPIAAPERWLRRYDAFLTDEARDNPLLYYFDWRKRPWRGRGEYYATVSYLDEQLGRVIDHLRREHILDETLVIFSSDNGPVTAAALTPWELNMAGETGGLRGKKRFLFEGGIRVPGILRYPPRLAAGTVEATPVTALDIFPTLAAIMGVTPDPGVPLDGQSLWPLLNPDAHGDWYRRRPLFWAIETPDGLEFALRDGEWKLLLDSRGEPRHLFNLAEDFYEVYNRIGDEPAVVDRLQGRFQAYRRDISEDPLARAR
jgi:arylsulfatase A-like enzyme